MESFDEIRAAKRHIRSLMRHQNQSRSQQERLDLSHRISLRVEEHPAFVAATEVLLYHPLPTEVDILPLFDTYFGIKNLYLPSVCGDRLLVVPYLGPRLLQQGAFGVMESMAAPLENLGIIQCVVVPGVAFDKAGNRLGYGKGYYDRLLPALTHSVKLGVCYPSHLLSSLPCEPTDYKVDHVLTGL